MAIYKQFFNIDPSGSTFHVLLVILMSDKEVGSHSALFEIVLGL